MKPPRIPIVAVVSLLLFCAIGVFAIGGRTRVVVLSFNTGGGHLQAVAAERGGLLVVWSNVPSGLEKTASADLWSVSPADFAAVSDYLFDASNEKWRRAGFCLADGVVAIWGWQFHAFIIPYWALLAGFAFLPALAMGRLFRGWRWRRNGRCRVCGYDLRHGTGRCPECGDAIGGTKGATYSTTRRDNGSQRRRATITKRAVRKLMIVALGVGFAPGAGVIGLVNSRKTIPASSVNASTVVQPGDNAVLVRYDVSDLVKPFVLPTVLNDLSSSTTQNPEVAANNDLVQFLKETVAPESWQGVGPLGLNHAVACSVGTQILVIQTPENQRRIQQLLTDIQALHSNHGPPPPPPIKPSKAMDGWMLSDIPDSLDAALKAPIAAIHFDQLPMEAAAGILSKQSGVRIRIDQETFESHNVSVKSAVSLNLRDVSLAEALKALLSKPIAGLTASYGVTDGEVLITDVEHAHAMVVTRAYDIRDLVRPQPGRDDAIDGFVKMLNDLIDPDSWRDSGGNSGTMHTFDGILVVTQTWPNHEELQRLLRRLRKGNIVYTLGTGSPLFFPMKNGIR